MRAAHRVALDVSTRQGLPADDGCSDEAGPGETFPRVRAPGPSRPRTVGPSRGRSELGAIEELNLVFCSVPDVPCFGVGAASDAQPARPLFTPAVTQVGDVHSTNSRRMFPRDPRGGPQRVSPQGGRCDPFEVTRGGSTPRPWGGASKNHKRLGPASIVPHRPTRWLGKAFQRSDRPRTVGFQTVALNLLAAERGVTSLSTGRPRS